METPNPKTAETIEKVGSIDDILIEILVHLPLKPLFRFKLVSKHWNSIISDPRFQLMFFKEHNNNNDRAVGLIVQHYRRPDLPPVETSFVSFDRSNPPPQIQIPDTLEIFHSCNGLLVLKKKYDYYVYNPTTNQKTPPLLKDDLIKSRPRDTVVGMFLAFDPSKSPHYKVLCVWQLNHVPQYQFEVYSSETGSCEIRGGLFKEYFNFHYGVYWNGAIHWVDFTGKSMYLKLDDHDEMPHVMPHLPIHQGSPCFYFGESCGRLHCAFSVGNDHPLDRGTYVYEMMRDYSEWFLKFRVDVYSQSLQNNGVNYISSVIRGKKDEDSFLVYGTGWEEIIRYDLVHKTCQAIHAFDCFSNTSRKSFQYIESPCSV